MSRHEVEYDADGLARNDPWSLDEHLAEDGLREADRELVRESTLSWLKQFAEAGMGIEDAIQELDVVCGEPVPQAIRAQLATAVWECEREKGHPPDTHCVYGNAGFPLLQWPVA